MKYTMTNALEAAVRFIPTPPAFRDISKTCINQMHNALTFSVDITGISIHGDKLK